ncbi:MAG: hypothetical protein JSW34_09780 [Candidatus Zixiibacteriota bacterium]|nr:MAG: hypothetical protein JSW34_09780 [candidate division Zixibacteria bacterium]
MENAEQIAAYIAEVVRQMEAESLTSLDFDRLKATLVDFKAMMARHQEQEGELNTLREDYIRRISGMEKAMAVAGRGRSGVKDALERIEGLATLTAAALVECYRKAQARFQDTFPASFGLPAGRSRSHSRSRLN